MVCCDGPCLGSFHRHCLEKEGEDIVAIDASDKYLCKDCVSKSHECLTCRQIDQDCNLVKCAHAGCGAFFHQSCRDRFISELKRLGQMGKGIDYSSAMTKRPQWCIRHWCWTCGEHRDGERIVECIRCDRAYHKCCTPPTATFLYHGLLCEFHPYPLVCF